MIGWISLHRKCHDHWLYNENRPHTRREAWEDILLLVNHTSEKVLVGGKLITCKRGQSLKSLDSWAKQFRWSKSKVRRFFDLLKSDGMIETKSVGKSTQLTVCNYDDYQDYRHDDDTIMARKRHDHGTEMAPNNNVNKNNNENKKREGPKIFRPPSLSEVENYFSERIKEKNLNLNPQDEAEKFMSHYETVGWKVGKNKMKDWKASVRGWVARLRDNPDVKTKQPDNGMLNKVF